MSRPIKITFGKMREMGVRGVLVFCSDYKCARSQAISADQWADDTRLSDIEDRFVCKACGKRGAEVRPDFNWGKRQVGGMGYRWRELKHGGPSVTAARQAGTVK
jgi:hypothetical protein